MILAPGPILRRLILIYLICSSSLIKAGARVVSNEVSTTTSTTLSVRSKSTVNNGINRKQRSLQGVARTSCVVGSCSLAFISVRAKNRRLLISAAALLAAVIVWDIIGVLLLTLIQKLSSDHSSDKLHKANSSVSGIESIDVLSPPLPRDSTESKKTVSLKTTPKPTDERVVRDNIFRRPDIVVPDVEPQKFEVPNVKRKRRRFLFWTRDKPEPPQKERKAPEWSEAYQKQKNYVEDYGI